MSERTEPKLYVLRVHPSAFHETTNGVALPLTTGQRTYGLGSRGMSAQSAAWEGGGGTSSTLVLRLSSVLGVCIQAQAGSFSVK